MRKEQLIIFLLVSLVIVSGIEGCEAISFGKTSSGGYDKEGLRMNFIDGITPQAADELTDFSQFQVGVALRNSMLNDVDGELCVYDSLSDRYGGIPSNECRSISLVAAENIDGKITPAAEENFIFPGDVNSYSYTNLQKDISQTTVISAILKYNVEAVADTQLCLKRDAKVKASCIDNEVITKLNVNPSPVVVSKIEKNVLYGGGGNVGVNLNIYLKKIDDGEVISKDALFNPSEESKSEIDYAVGFVGGQIFECTPAGRIIFEGSEKIIRCRATVNIQQDYINDPFAVVLRYGFRKVITTGAINVRKEAI